MALSSSEHTLTLAEFCEFTKVAAKPYFPPDYVVHLPKVYTMHDSQVPQADRWALHHLKDYVVSSISAGTIWLVERESN